MDAVRMEKIFPNGKVYGLLETLFRLNSGNTAIEAVITENRKSGELIISQLRLLLILFLVPAFILRIYKGEFLHKFICFTSLKLALIFFIYYWIYISLKKGRYNDLICYAVISIDTFFLTFCIVTLSFAKPFHQGISNDPLILGYFLVGVSSSLRFDYRYLFFGI